MSYGMEHILDHLYINSQGFIAISELVSWLNISPSIQVTSQKIHDLVNNDTKSQFSIQHNRFGAIYGHSMDLPYLALPVYDELAHGNKTIIILHETYQKCLHSILSNGVNRMGCNRMGAMD